MTDTRSPAVVSLLVLALGILSLVVPTVSGHDSRSASAETTLWRFEPEQMATLHPTALPHTQDVLREVEVSSGATGYAITT